MVSKFNDQQWLMESNLFGKRKIQRPDYRRATMIDTKNIKKIDEKSSNGRGTMQHLRVHKTVRGGGITQKRSDELNKSQKKTPSINSIDESIDQKPARSTTKMRRWFLFGVFFFYLLLASFSYFGRFFSFRFVFFLLSLLCRVTRKKTGDEGVNKISTRSPLRALVDGK